MSRAGPSQGENPLQPPSHGPRRKWRGTWLERDGMLWSPLLGSLGLVAGFTTKANEGGLVFNKTGVKNFDRNRPIDQQVSGAIYRAHPADTEFFIQPVLAVKRGSDQRIGRRFDG